MPLTDLVAKRKLWGLTQSELAERLGMTLRNLQYLEAGKAELRPLHLLALERIGLALAVSTRNPDLAGDAIAAEARAFANLS